MRVGMIDTQAIRQRWESVGSKLDERGKRVFEAGEVRAAGWGGLAAVHEITGLARSTIGRGLTDLDAAPFSWSGKAGNFALRRQSRLPTSAPAVFPRRCIAVSEVGVACGHIKLCKPAIISRPPPAPGLHHQLFS